MQHPPAWKLKDVYSGFASKEFAADYQLLLREIKKIARKALAPPPPAENMGRWIMGYIKSYNACHDLLLNLNAFAYMHYSVDTTDYEAVNWLNKLDEEKIPVISSLVGFRNALAQAGLSLKAYLSLLPELKDYRLFLKEQLALQKHQMTGAEEELAADLARSGADLWSRLQETLSSQTQVIWNKRSGVQKTLNELRALAHDPDRKVRQKAYELELAAWQGLKIPLAYALNGVKGFSVILNRRRFYEHTLERSVMQAGINDKILHALIGVMEKSLPHFRRYLAAKAKILGVKKMAFFDLFAPLKSHSKKWSFGEAADFIVQNFSAFSSDLGLFALNAFKHSWIDAGTKKGKVGGAYCISLPLKKESRVLCNFDGSLAGISTMAHELGHAYHHHLLRDHSAIHREYPMTLAETASIFSENIIINSALKTFPREEKLDLLELFLADSTQVIVDILSRYYFETGLLQLREKKELAPEELNRLMLEAQKRTYGQALDPRYLHPYMWAVKGHYYRADLAFYNFPYAFGLLFGLGLHALHAEQGERFTERYKQLLQDTGRMNCRDLGRKLGFNMETREFFARGMKVIEKRIDEFGSLA